METSSVFRLIQNQTAMYLAANKELYCLKTCQNSLENMRLFKITSQPNSNVTENLKAMENILDALQSQDIVYIYLIHGTTKGINLYCGIVPDVASKLSECEMQQAVSQGEEIFVANAQVNYEDISLEKLNSDEVQKIYHELSQKEESAVLEGVPGEIDSTVSSSGMEHFISQMNGQEFIITIMASPVLKREQTEIKKALNAANKEIAESMNYSIVHQDTNTDETIFSAQKSSTNSETISNLRGEQMQFLLYSANKDFPLHMESEAINDIEDVFFKTSVNDHRSIHKINAVLNDKLPRKTEEEIINDLQEEDLEDDNLINMELNMDFHNPYCDNIDQINNFIDPDRKSCTPIRRRPSQEAQLQQPPRQTTQYPIEQGEHKKTTLPADAISLLDFNKIDTKSITVSRQTSSTSFVNSTKRIDTICSNIVTQNIVNNEASQWNEYLNNTVWNRLSYGESRGLYLYTMAIYADTSFMINKVAAAWRGSNVYSTVSKVPIRLFPLCKSNQNYKDLIQFIFPRYFYSDGNCPLCIPQEEVIARAMYSQIICQPFLYGGSWVSSRELSYMLEIPEYTSGMTEDEEVYAEEVQQLSMQEMDKGKGEVKRLSKISLLVENNHRIRRKKMHALLNQVKEPVLLFERYPSQYDEGERISLSVNPFELVEGETLSMHVDLLKSCFAICYPFSIVVLEKLESAIYECFRDYGWSEDTKQTAFPSMAEVLRKTNILLEREKTTKVDKLIFKSQVNECLQSWTIGRKGQLLNVRHSSPMEALNEKRIVVTMEQLAGDRDKNFYMMIVLLRFLMASKKEECGIASCRHAIVLEDWYQMFGGLKKDKMENRDNAIATIENLIYTFTYYGERIIIAEDQEKYIPPHRIADMVLVRLRDERR